MIFLTSLFSYGQNNLSKIKNHIVKSNFNIEHSDKLKFSELIQPTIGVRTTRSKDNEIEVGLSKIGGKPDLPKTFNWPKYGEESLTFCAQYNLEELSKYDTNNELPKHGIIYVFIYIDKEWPGFLNQKSSYKLIYHDNIKDLKRMEFPVNYFMKGVFNPAKIEYFESYTIPDDENFKLKDLQKKYESFYQLYDSTYDFINRITDLNSDDFHQVLGEDRSIQSSVVTYFAERELNIKTRSEFESKQSEISDLSKKYKVLIQLDCADRNTDLEKYGGSMTIYFGIEPKDLKERNFNNVIMAFQGT
tara:strand:+ start:60 stop:968 length:909 start_codon:yes stop_codon:yes gene_type:complete